ncbi:Transposable element P [Labeo rohita]|uniref:Transposable element P n=1 Tax=Labeo rohita TaxID=84645 RepID=A0A498LT57_LABRO|nr:Transposable element P [Labeo rohita]
MECLVFICDQAAGNRAMLTRLGVTKEQPFFSVDGIRVFCLWDPPHLIKNIRNNWRRHGFVLDGNEITWDILEDLYAYDSHQEIRLCCRLTKKHVHLPPFASMRVRLATQVLSHSVAVGIKTLTDIKGLTGQHQQNYLEAARFCENFNGLFDCFNSKQLKDSHKLKCAISDASAHFPFFDKCLEWLPRLKLVGANSNKKQIPCVEGWQHNILCLKMLWSDLRQRHQVSFLLTNRLNQDCLENAFSSIRARGGNRDNPDSVQFECEYRAVATGLMFSNSEKTNCEQDLDALLLQFSTYASHESPQVIVDPKSIME